MTSRLDPTTGDSFRLQAFVDGELELASRLDMEARIAADRALREKADGLRLLRDAIREHADYHAAPEALRQRLQALSGSVPSPSPSLSSSPAPSMPTSTLTPPSPSQTAAPTPPSPTVRPVMRPARTASSTRTDALRRWFGWRPLATSVALAALMTLGLNLAVLPPTREARLLDDVVASHVRSTLGEHLVDVASSNHHVVKPWLSSRLDFSPPVHELPLPGSVFVGGRVDYLDGRPVAALVYRQGAHLVNAFVWRDTAADTAPRFVSERGYQAAHWTAAGMAHWVISDLDATEFGKVVAALRAADATR